LQINYRNKQIIALFFRGIVYLYKKKIVLIPRYVLLKHVYQR